MLVYIQLIWAIDQQHTAYNYVLWREVGSNSCRLDHRADASPLHHTCRQIGIGICRTKIDILYVKLLVDIHDRSLEVL